MVLGAVESGVEMFFLGLPGGLGAVLSRVSTSGSWVAGDDGGSFITFARRGS